MQEQRRKPRFTTSLNERRRRAAIVEGLKKRPERFLLNNCHRQVSKVSIGALKAVLAVTPRKGGDNIRVEGRPARVAGEGAVRRACTLVDNGAGNSRQRLRQRVYP